MQYCKCFKSSLQTCILLMLLTAGFIIVGNFNWNRHRQAKKIQVTISFYLIKSQCILQIGCSNSKKLANVARVNYSHFIHLVILEWYDSLTRLDHWCLKWNVVRRFVTNIVAYAFHVKPRNIVANIKCFDQGITFDRDDYRYSLSDSSINGFLRSVRLRVSRMGASKTICLWRRRIPRKPSWSMMVKKNLFKKIYLLK